jgi:hypothetical protein
VYLRSDFRLSDYLQVDNWAICFLDAESAPNIESSGGDLVVRRSLLIPFILTMPMLVADGVAARHKPQIQILAPHPGPGQETIYLDNPAIPKGISEKRGTVWVSIVYAQLWERKPSGHYDCTIDVIVGNNDSEKELPVRQDYFFAHDAETGRYWALVSEARERAALLGQSAPAAFAPPPPPPSYTVRNSDGSSSTMTPEPDGISQAGAAIANAIGRRRFQKYQEKKLERLDFHFHDAMLPPQGIMSGWLTIYGMRIEHPLRLVFYVGTERFVFIFGPEVQGYEPMPEKAKP